MRAWNSIAAAGVPRAILVAVAVLVVGGGIGVLAVVSQAGFDYAAIAAFLVLGAGLAIVSPTLLVALALPGSMLMWRVGGLLSVADIVLAAAAVLSFLVIRGRDLLPLRVLMWAGVAYLAAALPNLVLNPFAANAIEWVHEFVLVLGSLVVGFAIGRSGWARFAVSAYIVYCLVASVMAVSVGLLVGFEGGVYLDALELHKNYLGGALAVAIVLLYARPAWFRWPRGWSNVAIVVCAVGLAASGSRQGMIGVIVGILVVALRRDPDTGRLRLAPWIIAVPTSALVFLLVNDQLETGDQFNSSYQRLDWYAQAWEVWRSSPIFGVGLRFWYQPGYPQFQPPNAELEVLSSTGLVGLVGFLTMFVTAVVVLWRMDPAYGTAAAAVVLTRFTQAQFDLYWVAGQASLLWIVAGISVGAYVLDHQRDPAPDLLAPRLAGVRG